MFICCVYFIRIDIIGSFNELYKDFEGPYFSPHPYFYVVLSAGLTINVWLWSLQTCRLVMVVYRLIVY